MGTGIEYLVEEGIVSEVLARLKSGKEADVYIVRYGNQVVAAKVYKDRAHRSFKNNAVYKEGRSVRNSRSQRAIDKGSKFGKAAGEDAWKSAEVEALYRLHGVGVRVPTPVMFLEGVLLMELVCGADGQPALRLIDSELTAAEAHAGYHDMLKQLVGILSCDLIHGDLSPYNVLRGARGNIIIDFPQMISASHNSSSEAFFLRDARNILGHFANIDRTLHARSGDAREIWRAYLRRELSPEFLPSGRSAPAAPRPRIEENRARPLEHGRESRPRHPRDGGGQPRSAQGHRGGHRPPEPGPSPGRGHAHGPRSEPSSSRPLGGQRRPAPPPEVIVLVNRSRNPSTPVLPRVQPTVAAPENERAEVPGRRRRRRRARR
jgi:RIO kinase 1